MRWSHLGWRNAPVAAVFLGLGLVFGLAAAPARAQTPLPPPEPATAQTGNGSVPLPTLPNSNVVDVNKTVGSTKSKKAFILLPTIVPGSTDWLRPYSDVLDHEYDKWLALHTTLIDQYNLDLSLVYSFFPQWGTKSSPVYLNVYYPSATFRPFTDTAIGSGEIDVVTAHQAYFSNQNTISQAGKLGLITLANDWPNDLFTWSTVAYTHTLPGDLNWLSLTVGQYNLSSFDPSEYAGNAQTSFISYSFSQTATQTFPNAGFGTYGQIKTPDGQFNFAGGVQGGTDLNGGTLTTDGFHHGRLVSWGNAQWTPTLPGLGAGIYSLLIYERPFVPDVSSRSTGISFSASQQLTERYGAFLRINNATGSDIPIRTSYAVGGVWNNPIERNRNDQLGLAVGWDKANKEFTGTVGVRDGEWVTELFYRATIFKGMHLTPDVQIFWNPALLPSSGPVAVFTLRTTLTF